MLITCTHKYIRPTLVKTLYFNNTLPKCNKQYEIFTKLCQRDMKVVLCSNSRSFEFGAKLRFLKVFRVFFFFRGGAGGAQGGGGGGGGGVFFLFF
jgi:hypothetical protein